MKKELFQAVEDQRFDLVAMADDIHSNPELGGEEVKSASILTEALCRQGFAVETGLGGLHTAFRARYKKGSGGPRIGFLCEYDAVEGLGHGCAHHMQGPACIGAAFALKETLQQENFELVVYGTPAEETFGGKINMLEAGCFEDIDVALMMHGGTETCTDVKSLAMAEFKVTFYGKESHAAIAPQNGRSALDAMLLAFNGIEFLREHVVDDARLHYAIAEAPGVANVVPAKAAAIFCLRAFHREDLDEVIQRFHDVIRGAALMTGATFDTTLMYSYDNKIPVYQLNDLFMENARLVDAPCMAPPRERTGSTDFGNVLHRLPGGVIRVKFVEKGTPSHSKAFLDAGTTQEGRDATIYGAKILAGTACDLIQNPKLVVAIQEEFKANLAQRGR